MKAAPWILVGGAVLGCAGGVGACSSFGSSTAEGTDSGADSSPSTDAAAEGAVTDAGADVSDASDGAATCPGKDLQLDRDNCGACGRMCNPYSPVCLAGECEHLVFVTQDEMPANLGGLAGADAYCTTVAANSGSSRGNAPFKAWLSTSSVNATTRFVHGNRRYHDKQSMTVAADWSALVSGLLPRGIFWSEAGNSMSGVSVRTATSSLGVFVGDSDCVGWTSATAGLNNVAGVAGDTDMTWTQILKMQTCQTSAHLYCIEQ